MNQSNIIKGINYSLIAELICLILSYRVNLIVYLELMSTATIRERLFEYIRFADDKKVRAIYTMVEEDIIERLDLWEDKDFLKEIDRWIEEIETGKMIGSTWEEVKAKSRAQ